MGGGSCELGVRVSEVAYRALGSSPVRPRMLTRNHSGVVISAAPRRPPLGYCAVWASASSATATASIRALAAARI